MNTTIRQIVATVVTLAFMAGPVAPCCLWGIGPAHAGQNGKGHAAGHGMSLDSTHHHCAHKKQAPAPQRDGGCDKGDFCKAVKASTRDVTIAGPTRASVQTDVALIVTPAATHPGYVPAMLRLSAPPQGPPAAPRTPVQLNTTLRL